jgi:hypothetical protein
MERWFGTPMAERQELLRATPLFLVALDGASSMVEELAKATTIVSIRRGRVFKLPQHIGARCLVVCCRGELGLTGSGSTSSEVSPWTRKSVPGRTATGCFNAH